MKVIFISNIPSPYRVDFFNELGKYTDLTVTFERRDASDRDGKWKSNKAINYKEIVFDGIKIGNDKAISFGILKELRKKWDAIIIGGYSNPTGVIAINYLSNRHIPFFIEADGGFVKKENKIKKSVKKLLISSASSWFSSGRATSDYLLYYGADASKIYTYPFSSIGESDYHNNSMDLPTRAVCREKLGIHEKKIVLFVGQMIPRKGVDVLLKSIEELDEEFGFYIVGGAPSNELLQIMDGLNVDTSRIHFPGFKTKDELNLYYRAADVFAFPTREDIWGLVINEAMSFGLPIVTTNRCLAGLELVKESENGCIIVPDDSQELSNAINTCFCNRDKFGNKSKALIENYTIEKMVSAHVEVLTESISWNKTE